MINDDEEDIELLMAELRATMPTPTPAQIRGWADATAAAILTRIPGATTREEPVGSNGETDSWGFSVLARNGDAIVTFSSYGSFTLWHGRTSRWSDYLEGGPESIGRSIASQYVRDTSRGRGGATMNEASP